MSYMAQRKRRKHTPEQKAEAVRLAIELGNTCKVARDLDLSPTTLQKWVHKAQAEKSEGTPEKLAFDEKTELQRLRRENAILRQEREFLKKAAAFFAKEQD